MKILITTDWDRSAINGVVISIGILEKELRRLGHEVRVLSVSRDVRSHCEDHTWYSIGSAPLGIVYPKARFTIRFVHPYIEELTAWKPDIIHSQCELNSMIFAKIIAGRTGAPIVHTYHTMYEDYTQYFAFSRKLGRDLIRTLLGKILKKTVLIIAPSAKARRSLRSYRIPQRICVVPTGIDLEKFQKPVPPETIRHLKKQHGIAEDKKVVLTFGRLAEEKNIEEVISYLARMNRPDVLHLIVGDGPYRDHLEETVRKLHREEYTIFTGMVTPDQAPLYYRLGDIFVTATHSETQGLTYVEAMAAALPVLCRQDDALDGVVVNGENGYQYSDYGEFSRCLTAMLDEEETRKAYSGNALRMAERFSAGRFGAHVEYLYRRVLEERRSK